MAELADALASGASDRKVVWVQVPSPAPRQVVEIRLVFYCWYILKQQWRNCEKQQWRNCTKSSISWKRNLFRRQRALASGASDAWVVWVQVPSPAPRQVVEIRLVFLLLIHFKTAVAELHQIFDLVVAELVPQHEIFDFVEAELVPQTESASFRC